MKEKKKKRKILAALIPVLIFLLAVALLAQGVLKSEPEAVPNPVQGRNRPSFFQKRHRLLRLRRNRQRNRSPRR